MTLPNVCYIQTKDPQIRVVISKSWIEVHTGAYKQQFERIPIKSQMIEAILEQVELPMQAWLDLSTHLTHNL
jgi:hypothetical protein